MGFREGSFLIRKVPCKTFKVFFAKMAIMGLDESSLVLPGNGQDEVWMNV